MSGQNRQSQFSNKTQPAMLETMADEAQVRKAVEWKPSTHELLIMIALSVISFMVSLDACIIVTSLSAIITDLSGDTTQGFWVGTSYLLANAVAMPTIAAISDIFGRPICLLAALLFFSFGSLLCCLAHEVPLLLVGRSFQGVGGGGIYVLCLVIFTDIVPLRYRPKWYGTVLGAWALGNCIGPVLGGAFVQDTTWRWVFIIMLPFCGFGLISIPLLLTLKPRTATMGQKLARVDWTGSFIFTSSATLFLVAISWGGTQHPWNSVQTLVPLVVGVVGLACAFLWEGFFAKEPFLRHSLFWRVSSVATYVCGAVQGLMIYGQLYYISFYFLTAKGFSPVHTGIALFPVMFTLVPSSIVTGALVTRTNNYRYPIWLGWVLMTIGSGLTLLWDVDTSTGLWAGTLVVLGFGHGTVLNAQTFAAQALCRPGEEGAAAAMYGFSRQLGTALGVGVGGSVFQNVMALKLGWLGLPTALAAQSEGLVTELPSLTTGPTAAYGAELLSAYVYGFHGVYAVYVGISGVAFFVSLLIRHVDMNKDIATEHHLAESRVSRAIEGVLAGRVTPVEARAGSGQDDSTVESDVEVKQFAVLHAPADEGTVAEGAIWAGVARALGH